MDDTIDAKLKDAILHGTDEQVVDACEAYMKQHDDKNARIALGDRTLTWQDVIEEMRKKTSFGVSYLRALKESYQERESAPNAD